MPGPVSDSYEGPDDLTPELPAWAFAPVPWAGSRLCAFCERRESNPAHDGEYTDPDTGSVLPACDHCHAQIEAETRQ